MRYLALVIMAISTPSLIALGWFYYTKDPNLRPLGITVEALQTYAGIGPGVQIIAVVDGMDSSISPAAQQELKSTLTYAFQAKGVDVTVVMRDSGGSPRITYNVGKTTLGPYPTSRASEGVNQAVEAFRMHK
ncbi:MAG: hypothetical protein P8X50_01230 [Maritimibacter sp.]